MVFNPVNLFFIMTLHRLGSSWDRVKVPREKPLESCLFDVLWSLLLHGQLIHNYLRLLLSRRGSVHGMLLHVPMQLVLYVYMLGYLEKKVCCFWGPSALFTLHYRKMCQFTINTVREVTSTLTDCALRGKGFPVFCQSRGFFAQHWRMSHVGAVDVILKDYDLSNSCFTINNRGFLMVLLVRRAYLAPVYSSFVAIPRNDDVQWQLTSLVRYLLVTEVFLLKR